ncbi:MAG: GNAT family N-acetyltransferase [Spirochaetes bacterium]|nr:GNAT family N-acetyltransferase [Spirochaetota bacterium]MBN2769482.1 GNAT family N-acetyltransferase [Spirochaetota bacterium]
MFRGDNQVVAIQTERLIIRDNIKKDLNDLYELTSDPVAMRFMKSTKIESMCEAKENLKQSINESKKMNREKYYFAMVNKNSDEYIGAIGYTVEAVYPQGKLVELGYFIKQKYWRMGYTTEAGSAVIKYAFEKDNVIKVIAACLKENSASENTMIKLGLQKEGELVNHQFHENIWKTRVFYGLLKEDFLAGQGAI